MPPSRHVLLRNLLAPSLAPGLLPREVPPGPHADAISKNQPDDTVRLMCVFLTLLKTARIATLRAVRPECERELRTMQQTLLGWSGVTHTAEKTNPNRYSVI